MRSPTSMFGWIRGRKRASVAPEETRVAFVDGAADQTVALLHDAGPSSEDFARVRPKVSTTNFVSLIPTAGTTQAERPSDEPAGKRSSLCLSSDDDDDDDTHDREIWESWFSTEGEAETTGLIGPLGVSGWGMSSGDRVEPEELVDAPRSEGTAPTACGLPPLMPGWLRPAAVDGGDLDGDWTLTNPPPDIATWLTLLSISGLEVVDGQGEPAVIDVDRRGHPHLAGGKLLMAGDAMVRVGRSGTVLVYRPSETPRDQEGHPAGPP